MKHTSKNKPLTENSTNKINETTEIHNPLESDDEKALSLNTLNEEESSDNNEYIGYASNAYYYTGKSIPQFNIKSIFIAILGIIIFAASAFFYFNNKTNVNPFIGFAIGILLLLIALIQFIYKKN